MLKGNVHIVFHDTPVWTPNQPYPWAIPMFVHLFPAEFNCYFWLIDFYLHAGNQFNGGEL